ncbi:Aste57867_12258 [Aphanomyces stellatus]|uniref:Aste57867_12258 protein n=1 Tax=Aphanomyces stellatus TaxID=120398 RepID=A0A485KX38_9STRA|nr:hypothetical protein As57867_012213 [Aphanomyces stellatus]VFT89111.1 Aste57867_12258 [Aphanomyces stellatus]
MVKLSYNYSKAAAAIATPSSTKGTPSTQWQTYFNLESWLPVAAASKPDVAAQPTSYTKEGNVDGWVFLGEETDGKHFSYADVATGKREQVTKETEHIAQEYVMLPTSL